MVLTLICHIPSIIYHIPLTIYYILYIVYTDFDLSERASPDSVALDLSFQGLQQEASQTVLVSVAGVSRQRDGTFEPGSKLFIRGIYRDYTGSWFQG